MYCIQECANNNNILANNKRITKGGVNQFNSELNQQYGPKIAAIRQKLTFLLWYNF